MESFHLRVSDRLEAQTTTKPTGPKAVGVLIDTFLNTVRINKRRNNSLIKGISYLSTAREAEENFPSYDTMLPARDAGFGCLELSISSGGAVHAELSRGECESIHTSIDTVGLVVETVASKLSWEFNPTSNNPSVRRKSIELHVAALQRTSWLGASAMMFCPGMINHPNNNEHVRHDLAMQRASEAVKRLLDTAEDLGVDLCIANAWNGMFYSPRELTDFVESFSSNRLGVYFNIAKVLGYDQHPPHWIELLGRHIKRVHFQDIQWQVGRRHAEFCDLMAGDVPWCDSMSALRDIGYNDTAVAEMIRWDPALLNRTSAAMDTILAL